MTYRNRWDAMANPKSIKEYQFDPADTINVGDLMWYDRRGVAGVAGGVARPFNHANAWTGTTAGSQAKVAEAFLGTAMSAHSPTSQSRVEGNGVRIAGAGVVAYPTDTPYTFDIGDLIVPVKDPAASLLLAQVVAKGGFGADPQDPSGLTREISIGKAHRRYPVAVGVIEFQILGIHEAGASPRQFLTS